MVEGALEQEIDKKLEEDLESKGDLETVEQRVAKEDYVDKDITAELAASQEKLIASSKKRNKLLNSAFSLKEVLDRIGYGLGAHQFVTILFFLSGASAFLVGIINALRDVISDFISAFIGSYERVQTISKTTISFAAILFGFSFFGLVLGYRQNSTLIFVISLLIGSLGIVSYGRLYTNLLNQQIKHERKTKFLRGVAHYGLLITIATFIVSGILFERLGLETTQWQVLGLSIPVSGYFVAFELAAIMFILSGFILSTIPARELEHKTYPLKQFLKEYIHQVGAQAKLFFTNKNSFLLFIASVIISVVQTLGASFYGYYIFVLFRDQFFGGFLNIAIIFSVAILASFLGPSFTRFIQKRAGLAPMFVFGTLLLAIMPLVLVYNTNFYPILVAGSLAILGASIIGVAQGLLTHKLLSLSERKTFFASLRFLSAVPFLIFAGAGALIATIHSFEILFKIIVAVLVLLVTPLYFTLVVRATKRRLVA